MPDTEAPAPAAETTETTPAAAPEAKTGPARGKQKEAERIAAAAAVLGEIQDKNKPSDPIKGAPAAETETPTADAAPPGKPTHAPIDEEKPLSEQEPTNANYRIWRNRTAKLEKGEAALKARETRVADIEKQFEAWQAEKKLLREDPKAFWAKQAREHGSDFTKEYERLANAYMEEGKPDVKLDAALKRIDELEAGIADRDKKADEARRAYAEHQALGNFLRLAVGDQHKHTALTFRKHGEETVLRDAAAVAEMLANKHRRTPTDVEIAAELDIQYAAYYKEIVDSHSGLSQPSQGVTERVNGAEKPAKPVAPQAPKTLTNGGAAERATPPRKLTERERIEAATKLLPG